jgi:glycine oxidase
VLVIERGTDEGASWRAAAGMLAPQIEASPDDPLYQLGLLSRDRYADLAVALRESTGIDVQFWQEGIVRLATHEADATALRARAAWQRERGQESEWLEPDAVRYRWPWLGPSEGALWAAREAALNPIRLVEALLADAKLAGADINRQRVIGLAEDGATVVCEHDRFAADHIVIAAGTWSSQLTGLPRPLPVVPVRGQMAAFPWPEHIAESIVYGPHVYLVARDGEAIVGSTMEHAGFDPRVTEAGLSSVLAGVTPLCPVLASLPLKRTWAGLRPMTPDGLPILGREPDKPWLWYATGHGRNGILLAGITGVVIARLINEQPIPDVHALRPERFSGE